MSDRTVKADFIFFFCLFNSVIGKVNKNRISNTNKSIRNIPFTSGSSNFSYSVNYIIQFKNHVAF